jgi:hypothetical protein
LEIVLFVPVHAPDIHARSAITALVAAASKGNVDFAAYIVGLEDIDGYRAWAATAPPVTVQVIDEVMWLIAKSRQEAGVQ